MAEVPPTIPAALARAVDRFGPDEALVTADVRLTFAELADRVARAAGFLGRRGIEPSDRVAIWAPNSPEWAIASLAIHSVGAVLVPLNTRFKRAEARYVLRTAGARLLLTVRDFLGTDYVALLGPVEGLDVVDLAAAAAADAGPATRAVDVAGDDLSDILFTSGTTGQPKGVMLCHGQTTRAFTTWTDVVGPARRRPVPDRQPVLPHLRATRPASSRAS